MWVTHLLQKQVSVGADPFWIGIPKQSQSRVFSVSSLHTFWEYSFCPPHYHHQGAVKNPTAQVALSIKSGLYRCPDNLVAMQDSNTYGFDRKKNVCIWFWNNPHQWDMTQLHTSLKIRLLSPSISLFHTNSTQYLLYITTVEKPALQRWCHQKKPSSN